MLEGPEALVVGVPLPPQGFLVVVPQPGVVVGVSLPQLLVEVGLSPQVFEVVLSPQVFEVVFLSPQVFEVVVGMSLPQVEEVVQAVDVTHAVDVVVGQTSDVFQWSASGRATALTEAATAKMVAS